MKVILTADIKNVGEKGNEKEVKPGYARNFLFPNGLAVTADSVLGQEMLSSKELEADKQQETNEKVAQIVSANQNLEINFKRKASSEGKLFGSITIKEIKLEAEKKLGLKIELLTPATGIKEVGTHKVSLQLPGKQILDVLVIVSALAGEKK